MFFERIKKIFKEKDDKKRTENLIAFLIILVITLILMNKILSSSPKEKEEIYQNQTGIELVNSNNNENIVLDNNENSLEQSLKDILSKINGVGKIDILVTYQKENPSKIEGAIVIAEGARK